MAAANWRTTLNIPLFSPTTLLSSEVRQHLVEQLWPSAQVFTDPIGDFDAFFKYYSGQCQDQNAADHCANTQLDIIDIVQHVRNNVGSSLIDLRDSLRRVHNRFPDDAAKLSNSIELAVRIWLMIDIQNVKPGAYQALHTAWPWPDVSSLIDVVQSLRRRALPGIVATRQFPEVFNAFDMKRMGGFETRWTDNLSDHLCLDRKVIWLYYHVSVLKWMGQSIPNTLLPPELFSETAISLALLFPRTNTDCISILRHESQNLDPNLRTLVPAPRDVQGYDYWRDNLLTFWEVFDRSQPSTIQQWWYDRRNVVQWWTFWVAFVVLVLTIIFGLISSVASVVQAWASVKSLNHK